MIKKRSGFREQRSVAYGGLLHEVAHLLDAARQNVARSVNAILTGTYWEIGRQIIDFEQQGRRRADYGEQLLQRLAQDLTKRFGRGFLERNLRQMRLFNTCWPIPQTLSAESRSYRKDRFSGKRQTLSAESRNWDILLKRFPLPWSHYVRLMSAQDDQARAFYEQEAIRGGWSVRQLDRQISSQFYERTLLSRNKTAMLAKGHSHKQTDVVTPEEQIKDPAILEFLDLKDEYSETHLEEALIHRLEDFLLEMGNGFAFVARQKRVYIGGEWYRMDLLLYHRQLRCLVIIELKTGKLSHADAGQINLYLNYAKEHLTLPDENPPVGLILCAEHNEAVAHYALGGLTNKVLAARYRLQLPNEKKLMRELQRAKQEFKKQLRETPVRRRHP